MLLQGIPPQPRRALSVWFPGILVLVTPLPSFFLLRAMRLPRPFLPWFFNQRSIPPFTLLYFSHLFPACRLVALLLFFFPRSWRLAKSLPSTRPLSFSDSPGPVLSPRPFLDPVPFPADAPTVEIETLLPPCLDLVLSSLNIDGSFPLVFSLFLCAQFAGSRFVRPHPPLKFPIWLFPFPLFCSWVSPPRDTRLCRPFSMIGPGRLSFYAPFAGHRFLPPPTPRFSSF